MTQFIFYLNSLPSEVIAFTELSILISFLMGMLRFFGENGLYCYCSIGLVIANIQVLKGGQFLYPSTPIAMGTLIFTIVTLGFEILTEYFSREKAVIAVKLGFIVQALFCFLMLTTIGIRPLDISVLSLNLHYLAFNHNHISALFTPLPSILAASLIAYGVSQYYDVLIFNFIKNKTNQRALWLRTAVASALSAFIDTCIFSLFAWVIFNPHPITLTELLQTYIMGIYPLRLLCNIFLTPGVYLARHFLPVSLKTKQ